VTLKEKLTMANSIKAQIAAEFLIILSVLLIILIVAIDIGYARDSYLKQQEARYSAQAVALQFASELNAVYIAGDNLFRTVDLPVTLYDGTLYNISIYGTDHVIVLDWHNGEQRTTSQSIIAGNINGTTTAINGQVNITNRQGVLQIN
jgi:Flp pilus assembly protein TadG